MGDGRWEMGGRCRCGNRGLRCRAWCTLKGKGREGKGNGKTKYVLDGAEDERSISLSIQSASSVYSQSPGSNK